MIFVFWALAVIAGIGSLVCFIMVLVKMFQTGNTGVGIASLLLIFCGVGALVAFIWGWVKSSEYQLKNVMLLWTLCIVLGFVANIGLFASGVALFEGLQGQ